MEKKQGISVNKDKLVKLWVDTFSSMMPPTIEQSQWTRANELELDRLRSGDISSLEETSIYGEAYLRNNDIMKTKLLARPPRRRLEVFTELCSDPKVSRREMKALHSIVNGRLGEDASDSEGEL